MKGIVFNLLEDFIIDGWGEEAYDEIISLCPLRTKEPFIGPGTYEDADLLAIVGKAAETLSVSVPEAVHAFGKYCFPKLASKYPMFLEGHKHPKTFLKTIDDVIHVEVKKLFKDAEKLSPTGIAPVHTSAVSLWSTNTPFSVATPLRPSSNVQSVNT